MADEIPMWLGRVDMPRQYLEDFAPPGRKNHGCGSDPRLSAGRQGRSLLGCSPVLQG